MLKLGSKWQDSGTVALEEPLGHLTQVQITFFPFSCLLENRPERLNQLFLYLLLLGNISAYSDHSCKVTSILLILSYWKSVWKISRLIKEGSDIIHVDILAVLLIWKLQLQRAHLSCKKSFWKWPWGMKVKRTKMRSWSWLFSNSDKTHYSLKLRVRILRREHLHLVGWRPLKATFSEKH